jgi:hypothetical protein
MSKRRRIWRIGFLLSVALQKCQATAVRCWRSVTGIVWAIAPRCRRRHNQLEVARPMEIGHLLHMGSCLQPVDLVDLLDVLSIGDRIRILCDDGVVVAEKTSPTRFELIQCQVMSDLIH